MNKQQLASRIWKLANKMRSNIEANEYKDYILGFIFYKFLSDKEVDYLKKMGYTDDDIDTVTENEHDIVVNVQQNLGYFISYENLFSTWLDMGSDFNVANVHDALSAFGRLINSSHKRVFANIFDTLQTGIKNLGATSESRTKAISDLLYLIKDIPMDGRQDYDVLGFVYEYLISNFAANAGKKAGEFYTPQEVSLLMSEIVADHLKKRKAINIYDPTSGSGSLLINIGKVIGKHIGDSDKVKYYAQELKANTYNLTRMNLVMRGILPDNIVARNGDTLEDDWPYFEDSDPDGTYEPLYVDAVVSNPPYSQSWKPADKESDPRYARFGLAPKGKADYAFLLHDLYHLKPDGIMTIVLPHGVLFRGKAEGEIRKKLIEQDHIDTIIALPANIFFGTGIPTIIMVLKQVGDRDGVLFVDASKGFEKVGNKNKLRASDIKRITDVVTKRIEVEKFSRIVSRDEIEENDYNLNIPRYVDSSEKPESWDIHALMFGGIPKKEIADLDNYWRVFPKLKKQLFTSLNVSYADIKVDDVKTFVSGHPDVKAFIQQYVSAFDDFDGYLKRRLIHSMNSLNISKEEVVLSDNIFRRLSDIPLVDAYEVYQILDNCWRKIAVDLEIIQTEGIEAAKQVDPNMVTKKKNGNEYEVQDGWAGHVLPFDLVQSRLFSKELAEIKACEDRLAEIAAAYEEALDELPEDEKEQFVNDDGTAFTWAKVNKAVKGKEVDDDLLSVLKRVGAYNKEEKKLKKELKNKSANLHMATKATIESLTDDKIKIFLYEKWILPLVKAISSFYDCIIAEFISKLEKLAAKYSTTLPEVEDQILETEKDLSEMLDLLTGDEFDIRGVAELKKMLGGE